MRLSGDQDGNDAVTREEAAALCECRGRKEFGGGLLRCVDLSETFDPAMTFRFPVSDPVGPTPTLRLTRDSALGSLDDLLSLSHKPNLVLGTLDLRSNRHWQQQHRLGI